MFLKTVEYAIQNVSYKFITNNQKIKKNVDAGGKI